MTPIAVVHADESCLGNGRDGRNPGGAGALIEVQVRKEIVHRDLYLSAADTTNNRMALCGAIATFALLSRKGKRLRVAYVSDSEYLVKGMTEWIPVWRERGWRRKGGAIENLALWRKLVQVSGRHDVSWQWVRGHAGHAKNEYADALAVRAAQDQITSDGDVESGFDEWLDRRRMKGQFLNYDADAAFRELASRLETEQ